MLPLSNVRTPGSVKGRALLPTHGRHVRTEAAGPTRTDCPPTASSTIDTQITRRVEKAGPSVRDKAWRNDTVTQAVALEPALPHAIEMRGTREPCETGARAARCWAGSGAASEKATGRCLRAAQVPQAPPPPSARRAALRCQGRAARTPTLQVLPRTAHDDRRCLPTPSGSTAFVSSRPGATAGDSDVPSHRSRCGQGAQPPRRHLSRLNGGRGGKRRQARLGGCRPSPDALGRTRRAGSARTTGVTGLSDRLNVTPAKPLVGDPRRVAPSVRSHSVATTASASPRRRAAHSGPPAALRPASWLPARARCSGMGGGGCSWCVDVDRGRS